MILFFKGVFEYHHHFNQKLAEALDEHGLVVPESTYHLYCHVINAHQIWNARITGAIKVGVHDLHALKKCREMDDENYRNTLNILDSRDLDENVSYSNSKGEKFVNSIKDILFHVANHSTHHKGQIVRDFRQHNIPPLITDYIFYKRQ